MNSNRLKILAEQLIEIAKGYDPAFLPLLLLKPDHENHDAAIEQGMRYAGLINELLSKEGWSEKFSVNFIGHQINTAIKDLKDKGLHQGRAEAVIAGLEEQFQNFNTVQTIYIPLAGLLLEDGPLDLGSAIIRTFDAPTIAEFKHQMAPNPEKTSADAVTEQMFQHLDELMDKPCVEYSVVAEPMRARERGEEEARRIIDILYFARPTLSDSTLNVVIALEGEIASGISTVLVKPSNQTIFNISFRRRGPLVPLKINDSVKETLDALGFPILSSLLKKGSNLTKFEELLLTSVHWFAASQRQLDRENELLNLMTSVEIFFTPPDRDPIADNVATGVAFLLANKKATRRELKKRVRKLYYDRSKISHAGSRGVPEEDIWIFRGVAHATIQCLLNKRDVFKTHEDIREWLEDKKMG